MIRYVPVKITLFYYQMCLYISVCFRIEYSPPEQNKSLFPEHSVTYLFPFNPKSSYKCKVSIFDFRICKEINKL